MSTVNPTTPFFEVSGLSAWYGQARALYDIGLSVSEGEAVGLIGANGAGKTTLMRTIARVHRSSAGHITLRGVDVHRATPSRCARSGIALVREGATVFRNLTVREHLSLGARLAVVRGRPRPNIEDAVEWFPLLVDHLAARAGLLSGGQRQAVALATVLLSNPDLVLLDEPSAGLANKVADALFERLRLLRATGLSILVAEQNPRWLEGLVDRTMYMATGTLTGALASNPTNDR